MLKPMPGPWKVVEGPQRNSICVVGPAFVGWDSDAWVEAFWVHGGQWKRGHAEGEATARGNAHLIAAAPEMLEQIKYLTSAVAKDQFLIGTASALDAIAKAEGR